MTGSLTETLEREFDKERAALLADAEALTVRAVQGLRQRYLGRKGRLQAMLESLRDLPKEARPAVGKALNQLRDRLESETATLAAAAKEAAIQRLRETAPLDVSLPVQAEGQGGSLHPVTLIRSELLRIFERLGFEVWDGPEVDFDFYNFGALNFPDNHPAREMQDTFFVAPEAGQERMLLRTHTSNVQVHGMLTHPLPIRAVAPGRVYRCDSDPTHTPMFHQIEGLVVDRGISFSHLKGVLDVLVKGIFGVEAKTRFRPSFFPFVEPGGEVDMACSMCRGQGCATCKGTGWLEIGGCGMVHPNVFEAVGIDSEIYTGFAFGFGLDRMAMLKYHVQDLRQMFEGHREFLASFPIWT